MDFLRGDITHMGCSRRVSGTELEIDIVGIWKRALAILTFRLQRPELEELDLAGPILFAVLLASTHLLVAHPACVITFTCQTCLST